MASYKQINLSATKGNVAPTPEDVRAATEHQVNQLVLQLNANQGKFNSTVDAQGNKLTNLPWPAQDKDAVPLGYLKDALAQQKREFENTLNRRTKPYLNTAGKPFHIIFKPAATQNGTNFMAMSFGSDGPSAGSYVGTGTDPLRLGLANFTGTKYFQDHFPLPDDWIPEAGINLTVFWVPIDGSSPVWSIALAQRRDTQSLNGNLFNPVSTNSAVGTSSQLNTASMIGIDVTNFAPGDMCFWKFGNAGTATTTSGVIELMFTIQRNI